MPALVLLMAVYCLPQPAFADVVSNPTHLMDDQWNFPGGGNDITSISTDIRPFADGSPDGYFYATEFYYFNNFTGYMGFQDQGNDGNGNTLPKSAMISIYGATGVSGASGITANCGNPSGEGQECALHANYNWVPGHNYKFSFSLQTANDGNGNEVWSTQFTDTNTSTTIQLGTLDVPTSWLYLGHALITFHERFSGPTATCSGIKPSFVTFANVKANNGSLVADPSDPPGNSFDSAQCPGFSDNVVVNNVVRSGYGFVPGDINGDKIVNILDLSALLSNWGTSHPIADRNNDGTVGAADLSILISNY